MILNDIRIELHLLEVPIYVIFTFGYCLRRYQDVVGHVTMEFSFGKFPRLFSLFIIYYLNHIADYLKSILNI